jgi:glycosyltransferase involved in cell wall biosynthesis
VVSTTTPGGLELIEADVNGLLCPVRNPAALAARLQTLLEAPAAQRQALADAGRATVERHHRRPAVVQAYLDLYAELVARRRQGRA